MSFGNNPACQCCRYMPKWAQIYEPFRQSLRFNEFNTEGSFEYPDQAFFRYRAPGGTIPNVALFSGGVSRSYDVQYLIEDPTGTTLSLHQYATASLTPNWTKTYTYISNLGTDFGIESRVSCGDHGLIVLRSGGAGSFWIDKEGDWISIPRGLSTSAYIKVDGGPTFSTGDIYGATQTCTEIYLSPNSPHAYFSYLTNAGTTSAATTLVIGTLSFELSGGLWTQLIDPVYTYTDSIMANTGPSEFTGFFGSFPAYHGDLAAGKDGDPFWALGRGGARWHLFNMPDMATPYELPLTSPETTVVMYHPSMMPQCINDTLPGGTETEYPPLVHLQGWPGNILCWARSQKCYDGSATAAKWGTHYLHGEETEISYTRNVDFWSQPPHLSPIANGWAAASFLPPGSGESELLSYLPDLENPGDVIVDSAARLDKFWLTPDLTHAYPRAEANEGYVEGAFVNDTAAYVIRRDGVPLEKITATVERLSGATLVGTDAEFRVTFSADVYTPASLPAMAEDFEPYTCGTVTCDSTVTVSVVNQSTYDVTITNVDGGADGGKLSLTLSAPSRLGGDYYEPVDSKPDDAEHYTVNAAP